MGQLLLPGIGGQASKRPSVPRRTSPGVANRNQVYDETRPRHRGMRGRILEYLAEHGPATRDQIAEAFGKHVHQISGRFTELLKLGEIEETDQRRKTKSGHPAVVVRIKR